MEHSPTPWRREHAHILDADGIALVDGPQGVLDHIVLCVNAHDDLVAALERIWDALVRSYQRENYRPSEDEVMEICGQVRAALVKAI